MSPAAMPSPSLGFARSAIIASPVVTPMRTWRPSSGSAALSSRDRVAGGDGGAHGPLRVVLVGERGAEERDDRVADELLDGAAEALELGLDTAVVRREQASDVFGVELFGTPREADEVGEEDADDLALLEDRRHRLAWLEFGAAGGTEREVERDNLSAGGASPAECEATTAAKERPRPVLVTARGALGHAGTSLGPLQATHVPRPGLAEVVLVWALFGIVAVEVLVTYARLPPADLYNTERERSRGRSGHGRSSS